MRLGFRNEIDKGGEVSESTSKAASLPSSRHEGHFRENLKLKYERTNVYEHKAVLYYIDITRFYWINHIICEVHS